MDLTDWNRPDFAHRLLNAYLEHTGDYRGLDVLPFYLTYRALVRAKVAHLGWKQHEESETGIRNQLAAKRQEYLDLAAKFTEPGQPRLIITHGLSGSGKSFGTQPLVESLGAVRVRSDVERRRLAGLERSGEIPFRNPRQSLFRRLHGGHLSALGGLRGTHPQRRFSRHRGCHVSESEAPRRDA